MLVDEKVEMLGKSKVELMVARLDALRVAMMDEHVVVVKVAQSADE